MVPLRGVWGGESIPDGGSSKSPFHYSINKHLLGPTHVGRVIRTWHTEQKEMISNTEDFRAHGKERKGLVLNE